MGMDFLDSPCSTLLQEGLSYCRNCADVAVAGTSCEGERVTCGEVTSDPARLSGILERLAISSGALTSTPHLT